VGSHDAQADRADQPSDHISSLSFLADFNRREGALA
jgi:hypothetical protein